MTLYILALGHGRKIKFSSYYIPVRRMGIYSISGSAWCFLAVDTPLVVVSFDISGACSQTILKSVRHLPHAKHSLLAFAQHTQYFVSY